MSDWIPLTLAVEFEEVIGAAVVIVIMIASAITNWVKKKSEERELRRRRESGMHSRLGGRLDTVAEKRREQLQQQAQQRQHPPMELTGIDSEPGNLSMAERIARARAKAEYERRAGDLRSSQTQDTPADNRAYKSPREQLEREREALRHRRREQEQKQLQARREAELARRQAYEQQQARRRQQQQQHTQRHRQPVTQRRPVITGPATDQHTLLNEMENIHRISEQERNRHPLPSRLSPHTAVTDQVVTRAMTSIISAGRLSPAMLRQAVVLKELLNRPIALRDSAGWHEPR